MIISEGETSMKRDGKSAHDDYHQWERCEIHVSTNGWIKVLCEALSGLLGLSRWPKFQVSYCLHSTFIKLAEIPDTVIHYTLPSGKEEYGFDIIEYRRRYFFGKTLLDIILVSKSLEKMIWSIAELMEICSVKAIPRKTSVCPFNFAWVEKINSE